MLLYNILKIKMNARGKHKIQTRKKKITYNTISDSDSDCISESEEITDRKKSRQRQENSLGELTRSFINFIREQGIKEININELVKRLKVKKRRIYDITNVLEGKFSLILGIGYIKKIAKNKIQWLKEEIDDFKSEEDQEREWMIQELEKLDNEEDYLNKCIDQFKSKFEVLTEDPSFKQYGYVTFEDIKSLTNGEDINLIAIKAPTGTSLEIPDPEQINTLYLQTKEVNTILI
jgi:transcription factor E2F3